MKKVIGAQGEITIIKVEKIPEGLTKVKKTPKGGTIISHSEKGHHHILTDGDVMEKDHGNGMKVLYAILDNPAKLVQDAATPHGHYDLAPGFYEFRLSREYNPFLDEAKRVAD